MCSLTIKRVPFAHALAWECLDRAYVDLMYRPQAAAVSGGKPGKRSLRLFSKSHI